MQLTPNPEAGQALDQMETQLESELHLGAAVSARAIRRKKIGKKDIRIEYRKRHKPTGKTAHILADLWSRVGEIAYSVAGFGLCLPPFLPAPSSDVAVILNATAALLAAYGVILSVRKRLRKVDASGETDGERRITPAIGPIEPVSEPVAKELGRYGMRLRQEVLKRAQSAAASDKERKEPLTEEEISSAWSELVRPLVTTGAGPTAVRSRAALVVRSTTVLAVAAIIYFIFAIAIPKLPLSRYGQVGVIVVTLLILYLVLQKVLLAIVAAWKRRGALLRKITELLAWVAESPSRMLRFRRSTFRIPSTGAAKPQRRREMLGGSEETRPKRRRPPKRPVAIVLVGLAVASLVTGIWVYVAHQPPGSYSACKNGMKSYLRSSKSCPNCPTFIYFMTRHVYEAAFRQILIKS